MPKSMFSDGEYQAMLESFRALNPELMGDEEAIREMIEYFDARVDKLLKGTPDYEARVSILLDGRNFLARTLGLDERFEPDDQTAPPEENPSSEKHVAVIAGDGEDSMVQMSLIQVIGRLTKGLNYKVYSFQELLLALRSGNLVGIVALLLGVDGGIASRIESRLRHDLGSDWKDSTRMRLPPCMDVVSVGELIAVIGAMQKGTYTQKAACRPYDLEADLPALVAQMKRPARDLMVTVVDNEPADIEAMLEILESWPGLEVTLIIQENGEVPNIPPETDILLLDEVLSRMTGTQVVMNLAPEFNGCIVSTTGGNCPAFTEYHFPGKVVMYQDPTQTRAFISFMNRLIV